MKPRTAEKKNKKVSISAILQSILNISLVILALALIVLMSREIIFFIQSVIYIGEHESNYDLLERIMVFFLYFEFIALIIKYFQENYHFPLRYFLYIGITAMIRLIIVYHEDALQTLLFACAILVLIVSYFIVTQSSQKNKDKL